MRWMSLDQFYKTLVIIPENWLEFTALGCSPKSFWNMVMLWKGENWWKEVVTVSRYLKLNEIGNVINC